MKHAALPLLLAVVVAQAQPLPVDPWADAAWQDVLQGLPRGQVASVASVQRLFNPLSPAGEPTSTREVRLEFDGPEGRVQRLLLKEERRGEAGSQRSLRYVYEQGRLARIDEDGQPTPALTRRYDAAGRLLEQTERNGAVVARTRWQHDAAGRVVERVSDSGAGSRVQETRRYRRDGTLERVEHKGGALAGKTVDYDREERPSRIRVTDLFDRHETTIAYPSPTEAVHTTSGFSLGRGGGRYGFTTRLRVRTPQEFQRVEEPALPTLRQQVRDGRHSESQTDYDAAGRVIVERQVDASGRVVCTGRIDYHPAGPPRSVRHDSASAATPCGQDLDNEIAVDARGHWTLQRMQLAPGRRPMSEHTRQIEYVR